MLEWVLHLVEFEELAHPCRPLLMALVEYNRLVEVGVVALLLLASKRIYVERPICGISSLGHDGGG